MTRPRLLLVLIAALTLVLAACGGGGGGGSAGGPTKIAVWNGWTDVQAENFTRAARPVQQGASRRPGDPAGHPERPGAAEGADRGARRQRARRRVHVRVVVAEHRQDPAGRRHGGVRQATRLEVGRLLPGRAGTRRPSATRSSACPHSSTTSRSSTTRSCSTRPGSHRRRRTWTWDDFRSAAAKLTDPAKGQYGWLDSRRRQRGHRLALRCRCYGRRAATS